MNQEIISEIYQCISNAEMDAVLDIILDSYSKNPTTEYDLFPLIAAYKRHQINSTLGYFDIHKELEESIKLIDQLLIILNQTDKSQPKLKNLDEQDSEMLLSLIARAKEIEAVQVLLEKSNSFPTIIRNRILILSYKMKKIKREYRDGTIAMDKHNLFENQARKDLCKLIDALKDIEKYEKYNLNSLVFVIISFKPEMDEIYELIEKIGSEYNLKAIRVKDVDGDYRITDEIMKLIANSYFVIADLSLERPNVYYELGYARGIDKKVITLCNKNSKVHFDVQGWKYISYTDKEDLSDNLNQAINSVIKGDDLEF